MFACHDGDKIVLQLFLDHSDKIELNAKDDNGCTAFMHACQNGDTYLVKLLLNHSDKIELNAKNIDALHQCLLSSQGDF